MRIVDKTWQCLPQKLAGNVYRKIWVYRPGLSVFFSWQNLYFLIAKFGLSNGNFLRCQTNTNTKRLTLILEKRAQAASGECREHESQGGKPTGKTGGALKRAGVKGGSTATSKRANYLLVVYLVTALVPSLTACLASSPGSKRRTAVWISREVMVLLLL